MRRRRAPTRLLLVPAALAALVLAGCGGPDSGTVTSKQHLAGSTSHRRSCSGHGHSRHCRQVPVHHSQKWKLCLRDSKGATGCTTVSPSTYDRYQVGQQYP